MPALATTIPTYPRYGNLKDSDNPTDRQLESCLAALSLAQNALRSIAIDPTDGAVWNTAAEYPRPTHVTSGGASSYKTAIDAALVDLTAALVHVHQACYVITTS